MAILYLAKYKAKIKYCNKNHVKSLWLLKIDFEKIMNFSYIMHISRMYLSDKRLWDMEIYINWIINNVNIAETSIVKIDAQGPWKKKRQI